MACAFRPTVHIHCPSSLSIHCQFTVHIHCPSSLSIHCQFTVHPVFQFTVNPLSIQSFNSRVHHSSPLYGCLCVAASVYSSPLICPSSNQIQALPSQPCSSQQSSHSSLLPSGLAEANARMAVESNSTWSVCVALPSSLGEEEASLLMARP